MDITLSQDLWTEELEVIIAASADEIITKETYLPPKMTLGQSKKWFFGQKWAYFILMDGKPVGMIVLHPKIAKSGVAEVETWLLEPYRGLGISKFGYKLIIEECKKYFDTLTAWVWDDNTSTNDMLNITGFSPTGKKYELDGRTCVELSLALSRK